MYVSGFDVITLTTDRMTADQRRTVRDATQGLVGLEVIEEMPNQMVLQDLLDSSELSMENAVTRMRLVSLTMLEDAVESLVTDDDELAHDVMERDDDVDRLWYMTSRVFRTVLRNPTAANDVGFSRETCFDLQSSGRQLERIADHATKIAELALEVGEIPDAAAEPLEERLRAVPSYPIRRASVEVAEKRAIMDRIESRVLDAYESVETLDGVRVDTEEGWFLIRASGTQPLVRLTAEARTEQRADDLLEASRDLIEAALEEQ